MKPHCQGPKCKLHGCVCECRVCRVNYRLTRVDPDQRALALDMYDEIDEMKEKLDKIRAKLGLG